MTTLRFQTEEEREAFIELVRMAEIGEPVDVRTKKQNDALHVWCRQCAAVLADSDVEYAWIVKLIIEKGIPVQWDEANFKGLFRATLEEVYGVSSTSQAGRKQYNKLYEAFCRLFGGEGVELPPWPQEENR